MLKNDAVQYVFARGCLLAICIRTLDARGKMRLPSASCKIKQFGDLRINPASFLPLLPYAENWQIKEKTIYVLARIGANYLYRRVYTRPCFLGQIVRLSVWIICHNSSPSVIKILWKGIDYVAVCIISTTVRILPQQQWITVNNDIVNMAVTRARIFFQRYARFRRDCNAGKQEGHSNVFRCS